MPIPSSRTSRIAAFVALDIIAVGGGMGVPIFAILFGFPVGWVLPPILGIRSPYNPGDLRAMLRAAVLTSSVTFAMMTVLWIPALWRLRGPATDITNFGMPMILYEPLPSFLGWIVLMVVISPVLQVLSTLCGSVLRCAFRPDQQDPALP